MKPYFYSEKKTFTLSPGTLRAICKVGYKKPTHRLIETPTPKERADRADNTTS